MECNKKIDYLKSVVANKATLGGYLALTGAVISTAFGGFLIEHERDYLEVFGSIATSGMWVTGATLLIITAAGTETLESYRSYRQKLSSGKERLESVRRLGKSTLYCNRKGIELALKEREKNLITFSQ